MRTSNLIQSYISNNPATQQYNAEKAVKDFDVNKELLNRTFIKPLPSNGKLLRPSLFDLPSEFRKDVMYDLRALKHAAKGEANDHELGRLNDVGMKMGGLAIAAYLFTKKQTPMTKIFEFIGLGTFFAAMDLWPKLFIQLPAYLIHGVNVRQQYEDSFGRKKMFYQDHQFIPWDLYSEQEINSIGDRLNVPKDIPNRREFIQEKMRKIALQNNTLWMLTAGFATPVMSALMCNLLEKPVSNYLSKVKSQKADNLMSNFTDEIKKYKFDDNAKHLESLLQVHTGKPITPELYKEISANITEGLDYMIAHGINKDLEQMMPTESKYTLAPENLAKIQQTIQNAYSKIGLTPEELAKLVPDDNSIINALNERSLLNGDFKDFSEHSKVLQDLLDSRIVELEKTNHPLIKKIIFARTKLVHQPEIGKDSALFKSFKQTSATILTEDMAQALREISATMNSFKAGNIVLEKYTHLKVAQAPETEFADAWNEATKKIFKSLNFTPEEIKKGRFDREIAGAVFREKLEKVVSDPKSYATFMDEMEKTLSTLHSKISKIDITQDASRSQYITHVDNTFQYAVDGLKKHGMKNAVDSLIGYGSDAKTSAKGLMFDFISDRSLGIKSSFYRLLNMVDLYHRISMVENIQGALTEKMPREIKEECAELAKSLMMEAHSSDYAVKFWQKRNPAPNLDDYSQIESSKGKVVNRYFGKTPASGLAELSNDREYFKAVMKLMFQEDLHKDTLDKIGSSGFLEDFKKYRNQVFEILGGDQYFIKPNHIVGAAPKESTSLLRFLLMGSASDEMAFKHFNQVFNSKKWFNMFGKVGAGLAGATILSQFFFGHMKKVTPKQAKEVK